MDWRHVPYILVLGTVAWIPASAQESQSIPAPPKSGTVAPVKNGTVNSAQVSPPSRPGLWGVLRERRAERKRHLQETFLGYPEEFNEWPLGRAMYDLSRTEVANGLAARLILNHYDFVGDTAELNQRGQDKLAAIAAQLPSTFAPVIVERTPWAPNVAEIRRRAIVAKLAQGTFPVPAERVLVERPIARGLTGVESILAETTRLSSFANGGTNVAGSGFSGGGPGNVTAASISR